MWSRQINAQVLRDLAAHLNKIKRQGYEERESYQVNGIVNVSCPVFDDRGNAIAAMTVPFIQRIGDQTTPATARRVLKQPTSLLSEAICGVAKPLPRDYAALPRVKRAPDCSFSQPHQPR